MSSCRSARQRSLGRTVMAACSLVSSVSSRAIARVTQPHTSSKLFAACVRSSTVSSTVVRGG